MQATIGDRRVAYDVHGRGVPLLLMHAFPLNRTMYHEQAQGLSDAARVITFDAPGVGNSEPGAVSMDALADLAARLLDNLGFDKAVVGGVSMGGYAALAFQRRHPDRLLGLLLASTRAVPDSDSGRQARRESAEKARREGSAAIAEAMLPKLLTSTTHRRNRRLVERVRAMIESTPPETIVALLEALAERPDSTPLLANIRVPTLVIAAEEDVITPPAETRDWAALIPDAHLVEAPGAGHLVNLEAPELFNRATVQLLHQLQPAMRAS